MMNYSTDFRMKKTLIDESSEMEGYQTSGNQQIIHLIILCILGTLAFLYSSIAPFAAVLSCLVLVNAYNKGFYYILLPPLIIFYEFLVLPGGLSVLRIYSIIYLLSFLRNFPLPNRRRMCYLIVSFLYLILMFAVGYLSIRRIMFLFVDLLFMALYCDEMMNDETKLTYFGYGLVISTVVSCVAGIISSSNETASVYLNGTWVSNNRLIATFSDSNYLSLFINASIFMILTNTRIKSKITRAFVLALLYFLLIATASMTGIIINLICILVFLFLSHRINLKTVFIIAGISCVVLIVYNNIILKYDIPYVSDFLVRLQSKSEASSDLDSLTSERSYYWSTHWEYFKNQGFMKQLFGGNLINAADVDGSIFSKVSHQEYLDILLCVGVFGFALIMIPNVVHTINLAISAYKEKDTVSVSAAMLKMIYFGYGVALTMFLDPKFMFFTLL